MFSFAAQLSMCFLWGSGIACADKLIPELPSGLKPAQVWMLISNRSSEIMLTDEKGGCYEMFALQPGMSGARVIVDCQAGGHLEAVMIYGDLLSFRQRDCSLELHEGRFALTKATEPNDGSTQQLPISEMLKLCPDGEPIIWDPRGRSYVRKMNSGGLCHICLRTPTDTERWNCELQNVSVWKKGRSLSELRRIVIGIDHEHRLRSTPADSLTGWIKEYSNQPQLNQIESLFEKVTHQEDVRKHTAWFPTDATLHGHAEMFVAANLKEGNEELVRSAVDRFFANVQRQIPVWMTRATPIPFTLAEVESASLSMDDPAMRYWRSELIAGPHQVAYLNEFVRKVVLRNKSIPLETRLAVCHTLGNLGRPAILFEPLALIEDQLLCEAILFSRWQYPLMDEHVVACVSALNSSEPNRESDPILVESLVRIDELNRVPETRLEEWWNLQVVSKSRGKNFEHTDDPTAPRLEARFHHLEVWDTICITSRTPSGREFLRKRLETKDPQLVKRAIFRCLRLRAESTVRTKRWDFMTEAECETVLALPKPPTSGKDTNGGAARPFPVDE